MSDKTKDILVRALNTFWQAALAFAVITLEDLIPNVASFNVDTLKSLGIVIGAGALGAGFSALSNAFIKPYLAKHKENITKE